MALFSVVGLFDWDVVVAVIVVVQQVGLCDLKRYF